MSKEAVHLAQVQSTATVAGPSIGPTTTSVFLDAARRNSINLQEQTRKLRADYEFHMGKADALIAQINELVTVQHTVVQQIHALEKAQIDG